MRSWGATAASSIVLLVVGLLGVPPVSASTAAAAEPQTEFYVAVDGSDTTGDGTIGNPFASAKGPCGEDVTLPAGSTIYFRGGTYRNDGFGPPYVEPSVLASFECSGAGVQDPLVVRPYPGERVVLDYDGNYGVRFRGSFITFTGFEIQGQAADIDYAEALAGWWSNKELPNGKRLTGNGVLVDGPGITVVGNVIHDTPGAAINTSGGADGVRLLENVVYDAAWWSTSGTTGIGATRIDDSGIPGLPQVEISGNVVLRAESRIISHVFKKKAVSMDIDEGTAILVQSASDENNPDGSSGSYDRGFRITDNLLLHDGKGAALRSPGIEFAHNTVVRGGSTITGNGAGLRITSEAADAHIHDNVVSVVPGKNAVDTDGATGATCERNLWRGGLKQPGSCDVSGTTNAQSDQPFADVDGGDFSVSPAHPAYSTAGVPPATLSRQMAALRALGVGLGPSEHCVDLAGQVAEILSTVPPGGVLDHDSEAPDVVVDFPDDTNPTGETTLRLKFATDEGPDHANLCGLVEDRVYSGDISGVRVTGFDADRLAGLAAGPVDPDALAEAGTLLVDGEVLERDDSHPYAFTLPTPPGVAGSLLVTGRVTSGGVDVDTAPVRIRYDNRPAPVPPKTDTSVRVRSAVLKGRQVKVRGRVRGVAPLTGDVVAVVRRAGSPRRLVVRPQLAGRRFSGTRRPVGRWVTKPGRIRVTVRYTGDEDSRRSKASRRVRRR